MGVWANQQPNEHGERLGQELEVPLVAGRGATDAVDASQEKRGVARAIEVLAKRGGDDRALAGGGRGAKRAEAIGKSGFDIGQKPYAAVTDGLAHSGTLAWVSGATRFDPSWAAKTPSQASTESVVAVCPGAWAAVVEEAPVRASCACRGSAERAVGERRWAGADGWLGGPRASMPSQALGTGARRSRAPRARREAGVGLDP